MLAAADTLVWGAGEMGGSPVLGGHHSMRIINNQLSKDGVGGAKGVEEETRPGGTCGGGCLPISFRGVK
jgi:hypothetical protein